MSEKKKPHPVAGLLGLAVFVGILVVAFSSCGSHNEASGPHYTPDEQSALNAVHAACKENDDKLYAEAGKTNDLLNQGGVHDETTLSVLQHLRESLPQAAPTMDCSDVLAAYVQLRTKGTQ